MKSRVGNRLRQLREERQLSQSEMAEMLSLSPSAYSRIERNDTSVSLEQVVHFAKILNVPFQEFLPETFSINGTNKDGNIGFVVGNVYHYGNDTETIKELEHQLAMKEQEIQFLKEKITLLQESKTAS